MFAESDLIELEQFLRKAFDTVPYYEVSEDTAPVGSVAIRHDIDHDLNKAVNFARWEAERGFRSTYFILHSAPYYHNLYRVEEAVKEIVSLGHEIGVHNDALCAAKGDYNLATIILQECKADLDKMIPDDYSVVGVADHGGAPFTNGDIWNDFTPEDLGFEYEAYQLQKSATTYISDNQGRWRSELKMAQTFMLIHPIWWPV